MTDICNFLIVGTQRTGSSALGPDIACGWEWTQRVLPHRKISYAKIALAGDFSVLDASNRSHLAQIYDAGKQWLGFRRLFRSSGIWVVHPRLAPALWIDRLDAHLRWLNRNPQIYIVHIVRRDNLAWLRSKAMSRASGKYFGETYPADIKEVINTREAIRRLKSKGWVDLCLASLGKTNPYLRIIYEEFRADNRAVTDKVLTFLGCDPDDLPQLSMKATRQSSSRIEDGIANFEELERALKSSGMLRSCL